MQNENQNNARSIAQELAPRETWKRLQSISKRNISAILIVVGSLLLGYVGS